MSRASRRQVNRSRHRVEALEARALLPSPGSLDPTFGGGYGFSTVPTGVPVQTSPYTTVSPDSVVTLSNGNILVSATISVGPAPGSSLYALAIEELNSDGSLDTAFGTGGLAVVPLSEQASWTMSVESNGQILEARSSNLSVGSTNYYGFTVFRLNANGTLDTTFGTNGFAEYPSDTTTPLGDQLGSVATILPLSGGQILLAGTSYTPSFTAVRLNADGSIDTSYGTGGTTNVAVLGSQGYGNSTAGAVLQSNGQVVLTGTATEINLIGERVEDAKGIVIRLDADGTLDTTFGSVGGGGIVELPAVSLNGAFGVAVQPSTGDLIVEGDVYTIQQGVGEFGGGLAIDYYTVDRLNPDGTLDTSFATNGQAMLQVPSGVTLADMAVQANGDILLSGSLRNVYGSSTGTTSQSVANATLIRLTPNGSLDTTFGNTSTSGLLVTRVYSTDPCVAIQPVNNDIILSGVSTIGAPSGPTYGQTVASILPAATSGSAALPPPNSPPANLLGLGTTDLAVYDPSSGSFVYNSASSTSNTSPTASFTYAFGVAGVGQTIPAAADYLGLGYDQIGAYLTQYGVYAILPTATSPGLLVQFGMAGAGNSIPVPADYYGTSHADVAVYMPSIAVFAIMPGDGQPGRIVPFGIPGAGQSIPAPADYYHTGQDDIAVYLAQAGAFAVLAPGGASGEVIPFGAPGVGVSLPVPGDYDGSGKTELAVYIPVLGAFYYRPASGGPDVKVSIGTANSGEIPVPGDYDGSGHTEVAIYDPKGGFIEYQPAKGGPPVINYIYIGAPTKGSIPVATPAGSLPEFAQPLVSGSNAIRPAFTASSVSGTSSVSSAAITLSAAVTVPAGPTLASVRVARTLVNQASSSDPWDVD